MSTWKSEMTPEEWAGTEEQIATLVEYTIDSWDMSALLSYATDTLMEWYSSTEGADDFKESYQERLNVMGTPKKFHGGE